MWIVWIILAAAYIFTSGVVASRTRQELMKRDNNCNGRCYRGTCTKELGHWLGAVPAGMFWPISLLIIAGVLVAEAPRRKSVREASQRDKELEQARHETALAEERASQAAAL